MNHKLCHRMSSALSLWAAVLVLLTGIWADVSLATILRRTVLSALVFWILGCLGGLLIARLNAPSKPGAGEEEDESHAGETVEGV